MKHINLESLLPLFTQIKEDKGLFPIFDKSVFSLLFLVEMYFF